MILFRVQQHGKPRYWVVADEKGDHIVKCAPKARITKKDAITKFATDTGIKVTSVTRIKGIVSPAEMAATIALAV